VEISEIFSRSSQMSVLQDPMVIVFKFFFLKFGTCTRNGNFKVVLVKHSQGTLVVKG